MNNFADEVERDIQAAFRDMRRQLNRQIQPPGPLPKQPWRVRAWRGLRYRVTEGTKRPRRWLAQRLYDFEVHESRW